MLPNWNNAKAADLRAFLNTATGRDFMTGLYAAVDGIPLGKSLEEEALNARQARGARDLINVIVNASNFVQAVNSERPDVDIEIPSFRNPFDKDLNS